MRDQQDKKETSLGASAPNEPFSRSFLKKLETINESLNSFAHKIASILLLLLMFLTTGDVIGRNVLNNPITGTYELTALVLAIIIFFSLGMTQLRKNNIEIDFFTNFLPKKVQQVLAIIASLTFTILLVLTTWQLIEFTKRTFLNNATTGDLGLPSYLFIGVTIIGAILFTFTYFVQFLRQIVDWRVGDVHER